MGRPGEGKSEGKGGRWAEEDKNAAKAQTSAQSCLQGLGSREAQTSKTQAAVPHEGTAVS